MNFSETELKQQYPDAPDWFLAAIRTPYKTHTSNFNNCLLEFYQWGDSNKPLLILVHGNGGHANWWDFIAPSLTDKYCVCALHLSGMGNSGYRDEYSLDIFAADIRAVAHAMGHEKNVTIVGHSMGGVATLRCAETWPELVSELVILDSPLIYKSKGSREDESHKPDRPTHHSFKGKRYYEDFDTAFSRFRLVPDQPCNNQFLVDHVGRHSIREFEQGWSWKFDEGIYTRFTVTQKPISRSKIHCTFSYFYGGNSVLVPGAIIPELKEFLKDLGPVMKLPGAHHHVMLDKPLLLIESLQQQLGINN